MKKILSISFLLMSLIAVSQQSAQYSQYTFNNFGHNPAFAGTVKCIDFKAGYRLQWVGIEGAPRTLYASLQSPIKQKKFNNKGQHSVGLYIEQDAVHYTTRTAIKGAYSYHKKLSLKYTVGLGVFAGIQQYSTEDVFGGENNNDPVLAAAAGSVIRYPDIMPGVLLYSNRAYWSFSINQLYFKNINLGIEEKQVNQYYFGGGHKTLFNSSWTFFPSFLMKMNVLGPPALDLNAAWVYQQKFTMGVGYRVGESAVAQVKFNLGMMKIGYAFDYPLNNIMGNYGHEIMISFSQCGGSDVGNGGGMKPHVCPAYD
jgi:type IX secretion system PorP/SprF family membrane protein